MTLPSKYPGVEVHGKSIRIRFSYKGRQLKESLRIPVTEPNKKYAARLVAQINKEIKTGIFDWREHFPESRNSVFYGASPIHHTKIEEILEDWFDHIKPTLKASTSHGYQKIIFNVLIPRFGNMRVDEFKRRNATEWAAGQSSGKKRIANVISLLRQALDQAVDDEIIPVNPLIGWSYNKRSAVTKKPKIDPYTPEEQSALLYALEPEIRNMAQFWLWTGLRTSELIALEWGDIDWKAGLIHVNKALTQAASEAEEPKTAAGDRFVKILEPARIALEEQKQHTLLNGMEIFRNPRTGTAWTGDGQIRKTWKSALTRAKIRYRYPYQCRHTYASMMLSAGESVMWVAEQMGHASWTQTAKAYARWVKSGNHPEGKNAVTEFWNLAQIKTRSA